MPTYEYRCDACGHTFEEFQSITAEPIKVCPECHERKVRRLIGTGAALLFKGNGFYSTDYRSPTYNKAAKAEASTSSGSAGKDGGSSNGGSQNGTGGKSSDSGSSGATKSAGAGDAK